MTKAPKKKAKPTEDEIELEPDAWERFEKAVHAVAKAGPQHREAPQKAKRRPKKSKATK